MADCLRTALAGSPLASNFFLPVRVLSRVFRGKFLAGLRAAFAKGELRFAADQFEQVLSAAVQHRLGRVCQAAVRRSFMMHTSSIFGKHESLLVSMG